MRMLSIPIILCLLACPGCQRPQIAMSQLQIRQMQTRTYDIKDPKRAMKAVLNVLQDEAFIPRQADLNLGYIHAVKEVDVSKSGDIFWARFWSGRNARWRQNSTIECAANVTEISDGIRLRLNFQIKMMNNKGEVIKIEAVHDPLFYQRFFEKVDKGIFYEKEGI